MPQSSHPLLAARRDQMFPTLAQAEIDRLRRFGEITSYAAGERIVRAGAVAPGLIVVLSGKVEATQTSGLGRRETIVTHQPGQFAGELPQLSAPPSLADPTAAEPLEGMSIGSTNLP